MSVLRLIDALPDFGAPARTGGATGPVVAQHEPAPSVHRQADVGEMVRREVKLAEEALMMRLSVAHEAALLQQQQDHAEKLEALRAGFGAEAGTLILSRLRDAQSAVTEHVSATVARLVGAILTEDLRKRSIESLARSINAAMRDAEAVRIEVRGPQGLVAALAGALGDRAAGLHHIETEDFDLTVSIDGTLFETRVGEWSAVLSDVLA